MNKDFTHRFTGLAREAPSKRSVAQRHAGGADELG